MHLDERAALLDERRAPSARVSSYGEIAAAITAAP